MRALALFMSFLTRTLFGTFFEYLELLSATVEKDQSREDPIKLNRYQSPEQMVIGHWYEIEVIEEDFQLHRYHFQFCSWYLCKRAIRVLGWKMMDNGKRIQYSFYWKSLVEMKGIYAP